MKFAVLSDLHYICKDTLAGTTKRTPLITAALCKQALKEVKENTEIDTVLVLGDLTNDGDRASAEELREILRDVKKSGKKIYVITATHDFHHHEAYVKKYKDTPIKYTSEPWYLPWFDKDNADYSQYVADEFKHLPNEELKPELAEPAYISTLWDFYYEFGPQDAIATCPGAQSYCAALDDDTWVLMMNDSFRNEEALFEKSATFPPEGLRFAEEMIKKAKEQGKFIFACTHHPVCPPSPAYYIGTDYRNMRSSYTGHTLADMGINLIFTGHTHFSDVSFMSSDSGNILCDVTLSSTSFLPPRYAIADLDGKNHHLKMDSKHVGVPEGWYFGNKTMEEITADWFRQDTLASIEKMKFPLNRIIIDTKVKHVYPLIACSPALTKAEFNAIKDKKVSDILLDCAQNLQTGDGKYTPDTPEYKFMMSFAATADSIISTEPFFDIRKKLLKGYTAAEVISPLLFNNYVPDENSDFDFSVMPESRVAEPKFLSNAGPLLMAILCALIIPFSGLLKPLAIIGLPAATCAKIIKSSKPSKDKERY